MIRRHSTEIGFWSIALKHANFICFTTKTDPHPIFIIYYDFRKFCCVRGGFFSLWGILRFFISFLGPYLELNTLCPLMQNQIPTYLIYNLIVIIFISGKTSCDILILLTTKFVCKKSNCQS